MQPLFDRRPLPTAQELRPTSSDTDDAGLIRRILERDDDAFAELVERYHRRAFWISYHVLGRAEDARDVVQEAFVRVHRSIDKYDFDRSFYTWFYRIVMNLAIDALRKRRSARLVTSEVLRDGEDESADPIVPIEREETKSQVWDVLNHMDAKFKSVLVLRDIHGMSCREIAPVLELTHATVRWRLHRGRQIFRENWERHRRQGGA